MIISAEEKQAIEQAKNTASKYKKIIIPLILIVVVIFASYQTYQYQTEQNQIQAIEFFNQLLKHSSEENYDEVLKDSELIASKKIDDNYNTFLMENLLCCKMWYFPT